MGVIQKIIFSAFSLWIWIYSPCSWIYEWMRENLFSKLERFPGINETRIFDNLQLKEKKAKMMFDKYGPWWPLGPLTF